MEEDGVRLPLTVVQSTFGGLFGELDEFGKFEEDG